MISRRALFGTGAGVVVLAGVATYGGRDHRLDDVAREVGIEPRRLTAESDERLIKRVQKDQSVLLAWTEAVAAGHSGQLDRDPMRLTTIASARGDATAAAETPSTRTECDEASSRELLRFLAEGQALLVQARDNGVLARTLLPAGLRGPAIA
ncbi:MAG: hypothetical protein ACXWXY_10995, partial [Aeromicrobium sp.]